MMGGRRRRDLLLPMALVMLAIAASSRVVVVEGLECYSCNSNNPSTPCHGLLPNITCPSGNQCYLETIFCQPRALPGDSESEFEHRAGCIRVGSLRCIERQVRCCPSDLCNDQFHGQSQADGGAIPGGCPNGRTSTAASTSTSAQSAIRTAAVATTPGADPSTGSDPNVSSNNNDSSSTVQSVIVALACVAAVCVVIGLGIMVYRKRGQWQKGCCKIGRDMPRIFGTSYIRNDVASTEKENGIVGIGESSGRGVLQLEERTISREIELEELIGTGRFGEVYLGVWRGNQVAVKIFKTIEEASFFREVDFFNMSMIRHENILGFQAADNRDLSMETQLWMVLDYHRNGSLFDYLRRHSVQNPPGNRKLTLEDLHKLTYSISTGLMHLHTHIDGTATGFKPSVAHRDLKSKNILVKSDGTCCIADFGMAVRADRFTTIDKTNLKVGTRRYMAPEIMDGSIEATIFESFRKVDMYALALVIWEVATVCSPAEGECPVYRFPYEEYVAGDPSVDDMYKVVCQNGERPALPDHWLSDPTMKVFVRIMRTCWKQSPQSRFAANRVWKNIQEQGEST